MIPLYDFNPTRRTPVLTIGLIVLNVLAFGVQMQFLLSGGREAFQEFVLRAGLVPVEIMRWSDVGPGNVVPLPFTVFTSMFLHGDVMHLGGNMLYLWIFGNNVEDELGRVKFIVFYLLAGISAAALQVAFAPGSTIPMVGASGAIAGVLGAYLVAHPKARVRSLLILGIFIRVTDIPAGVLLGFWFVLQVFSSLAGGGAGVAWWAHIGGFVFGALVMLILRGRGPSDDRREDAYGRGRRSDRLSPWR